MITDAFERVGLLHVGELVVGLAQRAGDRVRVVQRIVGQPPLEGRSELFP